MDLRRLYPEDLTLESAHVFFRHGARTAPGPFFSKETGIPAYWPLCAAARRFTTAILDPDNKNATLSFSRVFETFRRDDGPMLAANSNELCNYNELTDIGRGQMLKLGKSLRQLYIDQLSLLPKVLDDPKSVTFRASPIERAQASLHHVMHGLFPPEARAASFGIPKIIMRSPQDETLLPNEDYCERFMQICKDYTKRTGDRWDPSKDMEYINSKLQQYMPNKSRIAVKSKPSMHNLHDIITSTEATGRPEIRLPEEFYDPRVRQIVERIAYEEEYAPFHESNEMRQIGIGGLLGDVVERMTTRAQGIKTDASAPKLFLAGSHDSTLAGIMASMGAVDAKATGKWPPYGSVVAIELFKDPKAATNEGGTPIGRQELDKLSLSQRASLEGHYVRIRYNDRSLTVPGCGEPGRNWKGDASFCTLTAFKEIVDKFTPRNWKQSCVGNLDKSGIPEHEEPAGY